MTQKKLKSPGVIPTTSKSKRIGFFSALLLVMGSCIGSGIFFKSGTVMANSNDSILLALSSWIIAAIAVLAMAMALIDITALSRKDDRGFINWLRRFNSFFVYKMSKNFFAFFYLPIGFFSLPLYAVQSLQSGLSYLGTTIDANGAIVYSGFDEKVNNFPWYAILLIAIACDIWFITINGVSIKLGNATNVGISFIKFFPIIFALIIGFVVIGINGKLPDGNVLIYQPPKIDPNTGPLSFNLINPFIGVISSLAAIFFAYDGFYVAAGIQTKLKKPKQISTILLVGLTVVTVIYFLIALSITLGSPKGTWKGLAVFFIERKLQWFFILINVLVTMGIIGIMNAYTMWAPLFFKTLMDTNELPFGSKLKKFNKNKAPWGAIIYELALCIPVTIILVLIGALAFHDTGGYSGFSKNVASLYSFQNVITNWGTVFTFLFISLAILGYIRDTFKRKRNSFALSKKIHHSIEEKINFRKINPFSKREIFIISCGIFSFIVVFLALSFQIITPFVNLGLQVTYWKHHGVLTPERLVGNISLICLFFVIIAVCVAPSIKELLSIKSKRDYNNQELEFFIENHEKSKTTTNAFVNKEILLKKEQENNILKKKIHAFWKCKNEKKIDLS